MKTALGDFSWSETSHTTPGPDGLQQTLAHASNEPTKEAPARHAAPMPKSIGPYPILETLGHGGMGVVYAAEDLRLGRKVALKVLAPEVSFGRKRLERLHLEAHALAALNHPNVVTVHSLEEADGLQFFTMELVHGRPLSELIPPGGLEVSRLFDIALPIAGALSAAHRHGIIHRDLKPSNIMVGDDGVIKVLDFGLAKLWAVPTDERSGDESKCVEESKALTNWTSTYASLTTGGHVMGTLPYMSPERLDGRPIDHRIDIFAFGVILYELATGRRPFEGKTLAEVASAILKESPARVTRLKPDLPEALATVIERCLAKSPKDRFDGAVELHRELAVLAASYHGSAVGASTFGRSRSRRFLASGSAVAAVAAGILFTGQPVLKKEPRQEPFMTALVTWPGKKYESRIAPDGLSYSFISNQTGESRIWTDQFANRKPQVIAMPPGDVSTHAWSTDGKEIALIFLRQQEVSLNTVQASGGPWATSVRLQESFRSSRIVRWLRSGIYVEEPGEGLWRIGPSGGDLERIMPARSEMGLRTNFDVSQNEERIAFSITEPDRISLWTSRLDGSQPLRLTSGPTSDSFPHWIGAGAAELIYCSTRSGQADLWRVDVNDRVPRQITFGRAIEYPDGTSLDGSFVTFRELTQRANLGVLDPRSGRTRLLTADALEDYWPSVSAGGEIVAFQRSTGALHGTLEILDGQIFVASHGPSDLTNLRVAVDQGALPCLSPKGDWLAYVKAAERGNELWMKHLIGGDSWPITERFVISSLYVFPVDWHRINLAWSGDDHLYFVEKSAPGGQQISRVSVGRALGTQEVLATAPESTRLGDLNLSPDGAWLAFVQTTRDREQSELHCIDLRTGKDRCIVTEAHGRGGNFYCRGWLQAGRSILALRTILNSDLTSSATILEIDLEGKEKVLGVVDKAFAGTARLEALSRTLYLTKVSDDALAHGLYAFQLDSGTLRMVSPLTSPGVSFSGLQVLPDARVLFSQQERSESIGMIRLDP